MSVYANVFGVQFPVCSEEQKQEMEAAYQSALAYEKEQGEFKHDCACDLITALLAPETPRAATIVAAWGIARDVYSKKQAGLMIQSILEAAVAGTVPAQEGKAN